MSVKAQLLHIGLSHFAQDGYEGASLSKLAAEAGIKKPSIYAHFKSKEDLFLQVLNRAARALKHQIMRYMIAHRDQPPEQRLRDTISFLQELYNSDDTIKFVVRMAYFSPENLREAVTPLIYNLLDVLEARLTRLIERSIEQNEMSLCISAETAAQAYMTCADGIIIEMLYGQSHRSVQRLNSTWPIYWRGIQAAVQ
ncbi:TetR/AcrR family transcriptional regulator [Paenibacillus dauci]|uniref:TetR/AcrR family transcriptional regulator n=1 Tax=Paenibacillus dauci TaxID=1567106 RepID=UPI00061A032F|nr:TetR/AcrR family transcriptional regulator [Paenibacillus dauci]